MVSLDNTTTTINQILATNSNIAVARVIRIVSKIKNPAKGSVRNMFKQKHLQMLPSYLLYQLKLSRRTQFVTRLSILALAMVISPLITMIRTISYVRRLSMAVVKETRIGSRRKNSVNVFAENSMVKVCVVILLLLLLFR